MRKTILITFALLLTAVFLTANLAASTDKVSEGQRLAMHAKPAVVRILDGYAGTAYWPATGKLYQVAYVGSGSGAFIDPNGYIATNAHVTDLTHQGEDKGKELLFVEFVKQLAADYGKDPRAILNNSELLAQISQQFQPREFKHIHHVIMPDGTALAFEIKAFGGAVGDGKDVSIIKIEVKNAPILKLGDSSRVQLQDHITVFGYPAAADTNVLDQKSALEASITDGKVSARKNSQDGAPVLQVSAPATHGNSGGPVLNDQGEIVGLLTFRGDTVNGQEVQGFNFVVPSSTLMEYVKQAGATNQEGPADKAYREGLELYWQSEYSAAIKKFETARSLFAQHSEADRLIRDSQQAIAEGKEKSGLGGVILLLGSLLALTVAGVGVVMVMRKKNNPANPIGYGQAMPGQAQPFASPQRPQMPTPPFASITERTADYASPLANAIAAPPAKTAALSSTAAAAVAVRTGTAPLARGAMVCASGPLVGRRFEITAEGFFIGRDPLAAQVVINNPSVSSRHAWIGLRNGRVVVVDAGSTNGTFVNAISNGRIQEVALNPGDMVIISETETARFNYQQ